MIKNFKSSFFLLILLICFIKDNLCIFHVEVFKLYNYDDGIDSFGSKGN